MTPPGTPATSDPWWADVSARSVLADLIRADAPDTWQVYGYPIKGGAISTAMTAAQPVAVVVEQRTIAASRFSATPESIPVELGLTVWVVVDGTRGETAEVIEDRLEGALESLIRILSSLPDHLWDGTAERSTYNEQQPAYSFLINNATATIEESETP